MFFSAQISHTTPTCNARARHSRQARAFASLWHPVTPSQIKSIQAPRPYLPTTPRQSMAQVQLVSAHRARAHKSLREEYLFPRILLAPTCSVNFKRHESCLLPRQDQNQAESKWMEIREQGDESMLYSPCPNRTLMSSWANVGVLVIFPSSLVKSSAESPS